jgi:predicted thioesterase
MVEGEDMANLQPGLTGEARRRVEATDTATALGSGSEAVFATPAMVALMEEAAVAAVARHLGVEETTVGVQLEVRHVAATPVGMEVWSSATLIDVEGRHLTFEVAAYDEVEQIGTGTHRRAVVDRARFLARTEHKGRGDKREG